MICLLLMCYGRKFHGRPAARQRTGSIIPRRLMGTLPRRLEELHSDPSSLWSWESRVRRAGRHMLRTLPILRQGRIPLVYLLQVATSAVWVSWKVVGISFAVACGGPSEPINVHTVNASRWRCDCFDVDHRAPIGAPFSGGTASLSTPWYRSWNRLLEWLQAELGPLLR